MSRRSLAAGGGTRAWAISIAAGLAVIGFVAAAQWNNAC
jgi:hypothetical protein